MPKADGDLSSRDVPAAGRDVASSSRAEAANVKPANATVLDDIPPTHVLEAAQNQDRKETEDLLAGFDRPGRGPKPVSKSKERDFVDYYARKKPGAAESGGGRAASPVIVPPVDANAKAQRQADVATVIVHRKREGVPAWLGWGAIAVGMLVVGGAVAYLATADGAPSVAAPTAPSAATTITSAMSPPQGADTNIPLPAPVDPMTTATTLVTAVVEPAPTAPSVAAPRSSAKRDARGGASASAGTNALPSVAAAPTAPAAARPTTATDGTKPPPRDDFIRDL
jgi:hypothetical protein